MRRLAGTACVALLVLSGCRTVERLPEVPSSPPTIVGGIRLRVPVPPGLDLAALRGKRIVIDPGHGGPFPGATGPGGTFEGDVNLGVALHLYGLLAQAGADAVLTRSADAGTGTAAKGVSALKSDLIGRSAKAQGECDLFVSIHHNDRVPGAGGGDDAAVYYRILEGDAPSASHDAAESVLAELSSVFHPASSKTYPGNYMVLRETDAPAILGEPLFLTIPARERMLSLASAQRLEAECYFVGIAAYFAKGVPQIASFSLADDAATVPRPDLSWILSDGGGGGGIDPASVLVELDDLPATAEVTDGPRPGTVAIHARPPGPLANGPHAAVVRARNRNGNSLYARRVPFEVDCPPVPNAPLTASAEPSPAPPRTAAPPYIGILQGRRILVEGQDASDLEARFREAGALVRSVDPRDGLWQKIRRATWWGAEAYVRLERQRGEKQSVSLSHHASATEGRDMARRIAALFRENPEWDVRVVADGDTTSLQMPCPAVVVRARFPGDRSGGPVPEEAACIVEGIAAALATDPDRFASVKGTAWPAGGSDPATARIGLEIRVDGVTRVLWRADGSFRASGISPGRHTIGIFRETDRVALAQAEVEIRPGDKIVTARVGETPPVVARRVPPAPAVVPQRGCFASLFGR